MSSASCTVGADEDPAEDHIEPPDRIAATEMPMLSVDVFNSSSYVSYSRIYSNSTYFASKRSFSKARLAFALISSVFIS